MLRMSLAFALRRVKLLTSQQRIRQYMAHLENFFIQHFHMNRALKMEFFACEKFAEDLCTEVVDDVLVGGLALVLEGSTFFKEFFHFHKMKMNPVPQFR